MLCVKYTRGQIQKSQSIYYPDQMNFKVQDLLKTFPRHCCIKDCRLNKKNRISMSITGCRNEYSKYSVLVL